MYNEENVGKISLIKISMQSNKSVAIFCLYYTATNLNIHNFRKKITGKWLLYAARHFSSKDKPWITCNKNLLNWSKSKCGFEQNFVAMQLSCDT